MKRSAGRRERPLASLDKDGAADVLAGVRSQSRRPREPEARNRIFSRFASSNPLISPDLAPEMEIFQRKISLPAGRNRTLGGRFGGGLGVFETRFE